MLSKHFKRSEFACKCGCGFDVVDVELLGILEQVRQQFGPVTITSGCRCRSHNKAIGGAKKSQHIIGKAADIKVSYCSPDKIAKYLRKKYPNKYGIGLYPGWLHVDVRQAKARWEK